MSKQTKPNSPSKRKFLQGLSLLLGSTAASQLLSGNALANALQYQRKLEQVPAAGKLFNVSEIKTLACICAVVIPKTDTAGAIEVNCHGFIDNQLYHCYAATEQKKIKVLLKTIEVKAQKQAESFSSMTAEKQYEMLVNLEKAQHGFSPEDRLAFKQLKHLIVFGYYTSEAGATMELAYQAIPGDYKGSVPYDSVGKAWGSLAYY